MAQLRHDYPQFQAQQAEVVVVGPETPLLFRSYWQENNLPFIGLPDPKSKVLKTYGQEISLFKFGRMPAQVIVDKSGIARYVHYGNSMSDIPDTDQILDVLKTLNREYETR